MEALSFWSSVYCENRPTKPQIHAGTEGDTGFQRWVTKLMGYDFEIQYRLGIENKAVDALSRIPTQVEFAAITCPVEVNLRSLLDQIEVDPRLARVKKELQNDPDSHPHFSLDQGWLLYKGRMVLPSSSTLIPILLHEYHRAV